MENLSQFNDIKENYNLMESFLLKIGQVALARSVTGSSVARQQVELKKNSIRSMREQTVDATAGATPSHQLEVTAGVWNVRSTNVVSTEP